MTVYFGYGFSADAAALLKLAARGEESRAIAQFGNGGYRPSGEELSQLVAALLAIKSVSLASAITRTLYAEQPNSVDHAYWHSLSEVYAKRPDDAIKIASDATNALGANARLHRVVGLAMMSVGSLNNAGSVLQAAHQMNQSSTSLAYLAEVLRLMGRTRDALACFERCFAMGSTDAEAYYLAGNALYDAGQIDQAIKRYEQAIAARPFYLDAHDSLNKALWEHGRQEVFLKSFEQAAQQMPDLLALQLRHAYFRIMAGKLNEAEQQLSACLDTFEPNAKVYAELATVRLQLDESYDALPLYEKAYALDPHEIGLIKSYSRTLIGRQSYKRAAGVLAGRDPADQFDQECLAYLAACNVHINPDEAKRINDYEGLVQVFDLSPPQGYASQAAFNRALLGALQPLHRSDVAPIDQTLVRGTQTHGNLFKSDNAAIKQLENQLRACIGQYIRHLSQTAPGEFRDRITDNFEFSGAWSVQLSDGGYHLDHVHSAGWISSVYYVEVPDDLDADAHEGWLKFGDTHFDPQNDGPHRFVEPKGGRLVLFPSYMLHGTVPIDAGKRRTTVAFDVVPY